MQLIHKCDKKFDDILKTKFSNVKNIKKIKKNRKNMFLITVASFSTILIISLSLVLVIAINNDVKSVRTFEIDYEANTFLMNKKPFQYVSGSFHYFRALPETWKTKLRTMKAAGLNTIDTYVEWSLHNPKEGVYNFDGIANLTQFIDLAQEEGLYIILRPGPYICAERDNGGLPYWLFKKYPNIKVRTNDSNYTKEVSIWYSILMPKLQKYFYGNGGQIIMVQVENEYGAFYACDKSYLNWLHDETQKYVQNNAILFTTDIPDERIHCGKIDGVFATTDFGAERAHEIDEIWKILRSVQPNGPLVNSEFYPGWLTHWQEENQRRSADIVANALRKILQSGANVNIYMFYGGSNFGFTAGANNWGIGNYTPDITSYDYDAIMDESGDPTEKYFKIYDVIKDYLNISQYPSIIKKQKMSIKSIELKPILELLSNDGKNLLAKKTIINKYPLSFEELDQFSGLVLYECDLPEFEIDPTLLIVNELHDRALVYIDQIFLGTLSRENNINSIPINAGFGKKLQLLVENQGRINFNIANDTKGIFGKITLQKLNGKNYELQNWTSISIPLEENDIKNILENRKDMEISLNSKGLLLNGPVLFYGEFVIDTDIIYDTYIDPNSWGKGVIYVNDFNLGRYWPLVGSQITLYLPKELLKKGENKIIMLEYQKFPIDKKLDFTKTPKLDKITGVLQISSRPPMDGALVEFIDKLHQNG